MRDALTLLMLCSMVRPGANLCSGVSAGMVADVEGLPPGAGGDGAAAGTGEKPVQHPLMTVHDGGVPDDAEVWDATFEVWLAASITAYLDRHPAPASSALAHDARLSAQSLARDARARLQAVGHQPVRLTSAG